MDPDGETPEPTARPAPVPGCAVVGIAARTRSRRAADGALALAVVPAGHGAEVWLTAQTAGVTCAHHPAWRVVGMEVDGGARSGADLALKVPPWRMGVRRWLGAVVPRTYRVAVGSCAGDQRLMEIRTYPADRLSVSFDPTQLAAMREAFDAVQYTFGYWIDGFRIHALEGSLKLDAGWEEAEDHTAFYRWSLEVGFDPLIGVAGRFALGPLAAFPRFMRDYLLDGGMFVDVVGKISVGGSVGRLTPGAVGGQLKTEGALEFGLGVQAHVLRRVARVEVSGRTAMTAEAAVVDAGNGEPALGLRVSWGGMRGEMKLSLVGGLQFTTAVTVKEPEVLIDRVIPLTSIEAMEAMEALEAPVKALPEALPEAPVKALTEGRS